MKIGKSVFISEMVPFFRIILTSGLFGKISKYSLFLIFFIVLILENKFSLDKLKTNVFRKLLKNVRSTFKTVE